jgi:glycosyltransferase involved in cell wall biosynthesis
VHLAGFRFGEGYREAQSHPYLYIQATEVGGTHPALIEAMAFGNCVVANGTPENLEVLGGAGRFYYRNDFDHLGGILRELSEDPEGVASYRVLAAHRAGARYSWDGVTTAYERLFERLRPTRRWGGGASVAGEGDQLVCALSGDEFAIRCPIVCEVVPSW